MNPKEVRQKIWNFLQPAKTIPSTSWTAKSRWSLTPKTFIFLIVGLALFGVGEALLIQSTLGNSPWSVFAQGLSLQTPLSIGVSTAVTSLGVLILWIPLREKPGFGTLANIAVISIFIQLGVDNIPAITMNLPLQLLYVIVGIGLVGLGSALYITCGLGPGPRDGLMTSLHKKSGIRISRVRLSIEVTVLLAGMALGGSVGVGTAMFALFIGNSIATNLNLITKFSNRLA
ncbi:MAG: YitT family protein [Actinomycetota bacterium]|nr:YitT family protein [Actinomycetota bacterium]